MVFHILLTRLPQVTTTTTFESFFLILKSDNSVGYFHRNARLFFEVACDRSSAFKKITEKLKALDFDYI